MAVVDGVVRVVDVVSGAVVDVVVDKQQALDAIQGMLAVDHESDARMDIDRVLLLAAVAVAQAMIYVDVVVVVVAFGAVIAIAHHFHEE
jgi:hypothetical protein